MRSEHFMGRLRALNHQVSTRLQPEHLIGRGAQCNLRLHSAFVSTQHAIIRWNGNAWELVDRGSRNGTFLNDVRIPAGASHVIEVGSLIAFGHHSEAWEVVDTSPPEVCVFGLDVGVELIATDNVIGVPSDEEPACTVFCDVDGCWKLEFPDGPVSAIDDGHTWQAGGTSWRFSSPAGLGRTATSEQTLEQRKSTLLFRVSSDEEFVELCVEDRRGTVNLGARSHNYLLLLLAEARLADRDAGHLETNCGWSYKEDIADALCVTPQQVDVEVHRIRKHFAQHGLDEASTIIDRRPRTRQLRLGVPSVRIFRG